MYSWRNVVNGLFFNLSGGRTNLRARAAALTAGALGPGVPRADAVDGLAGCDAAVRERLRPGMHAVGGGGQRAAPGMGQSRVSVSALAAGHSTPSYAASVTCGETAEPGAQQMGGA